MSLKLFVLVFFVFIGVGCVVSENGADTGAIDRLVAVSTTSAPKVEHVARKYSPWSRWSPCGQKCEQKRFRSCLLTNEDLCAHGPLHVQARACSRGRCTHTAPRSVPNRHAEDLFPGTHSVLEEFFYSDWSRWSACYLSDCKQYRTKVCRLYPMCGDRMLVQQKTCCVDPRTRTDGDPTDKSTTTAATARADGAPVPAPNTGLTGAFYHFGATNKCQTRSIESRIKSILVNCNGIIHSWRF